HGSRDVPAKRMQCGLSGTVKGSNHGDATCGLKIAVYSIVEHETIAVARAGVIEESIQTAREAHLRYVNDNATHGITRKRSGQGFTYLGAHGKIIHDAETLLRIRRLAIPPAWTDVWIGPYANGHI